MEADDLEGPGSRRGCLLAGQVHGDGVRHGRAAHTDTVFTENGLMGVGRSQNLKKVERL